MRTNISNKQQPTRQGRQPWRSGRLRNRAAGGGLNGYNENSKMLSCGHPKDGKGIVQAVRSPPGEDNRTSIWEISSSPCAKARPPKSRRIGQASPADQ